MPTVDDGEPFPLGACFDGRGVNFALFSASATAVDLCLFDPSGRHQTMNVALPRRTDQVWHGYLRGLMPGELYGYRVHGPYEPANGHRFNPRKLVLDPYARQLSGQLRWHDALLGYRHGAHGEHADRRDSAPFVPKAVVEDPAHYWGDDRPPRHAWRDTIIYEAHIKGLTQLHPDVPLAMRGTYSALGHPAVIDHLVKLGITAVELLPIQSYVDERFLAEKGLRNYWGYSTLGFFAPEPRYLSGEGINGLKAAIRALHDARIEVILDIVFNHTCEGNHLGPTLSFRGIDNLVYYKHAPGAPGFYLDVTGTGNTLDLSHPRVLQMALDSLRHWVSAYHVDGFRLDLAAALARDPYDFSDRAGFLRAVSQDPVLSRVKMIAEPWDVGEGGYRLGSFPSGWGEWNDKFRDPARGFWRGDEGMVAPLARALAGSSEIFAPRGRHPTASINYVTSHDGYTLNDLVSYEHRHNAANGEDGRDGHAHNLSSNGGVEGPTGNPQILALRARQKRNFLATALLSIGVPMVLMGDEFSRTQSGNNNAYCQDNHLSWLDWEAGRAADPTLLGFVQSLIRFRKRYQAFRRDDFLNGGNGQGGRKDVYWLAPEGREMSEADWAEPGRRAFGMQIGNDAADGERFLLLFNGGREPVDFTLPADFLLGPLEELVDTGNGDAAAGEATVLAPGSTIALEANAFMLFREIHRRAAS